MAKFNEDGNLLGRFGAFAVLGLCGFFLSKICCLSNSMCPVSKATRSCSMAQPIGK